MSTRRREERRVFRGTNRHKGRRVAVTPENSAMKRLAYGRIILDAEGPGFVGVVRDGDAVVMPQGFHPNVAVPGHPINFVWMMAARREREDRQFGVVRLQPGFDQSGSGLEASRK